MSNADRPPELEEKTIDTVLETADRVSRPFFVTLGLIVCAFVALMGALFGLFATVEALGQSSAFLFAVALYAFSSSGIATYVFLHLWSDDAMLDMPPCAL